MKEEIIKNLIEVEEHRKQVLENKLDKLFIKYKTYHDTSCYFDIQNTIEHISNCESKIISYTLDNTFKSPTELIKEAKPGELYDLYYSNMKNVEKDIITEEELINKCDDYLDMYCNTQGTTKKLREFGNHSTIQLTKIYCDAYKQALKDNNLIK
jgi:hypothetical protein